MLPVFPEVLPVFPEVLPVFPEVLPEAPVVPVSVEVPVVPLWPELELLLCFLCFLPEVWLWSVLVWPLWSVVLPD